MAENLTGSKASRRALSITLLALGPRMWTERVKHGCLARRNHVPSVSSVNRQDPKQQHPQPQSETRQHRPPQPSEFSAPPPITNRRDAKRDHSDSKHHLRSPTATPHQTLAGSRTHTHDQVNTAATAQTTARRKYPNHLCRLHTTYKIARHGRRTPGPYLRSFYVGEKKC